MKKFMKFGRNAIEYLHQVDVELLIQYKIEPTEFKEVPKSQKPVKVKDKFMCLLTFAIYSCL